MAVGSSSNWYACHWYMGAYFTRLADLRVLRVCYLTLLSPSLLFFPSCSSLFSFLLTYFSPSFLLSLLLSFSFYRLFSFLSSFSRARPAGDQATNMRVNYAYPLLRYLTCLWLERAGNHARWEKKITRHARRYRETFDHGIQPSQHNDYGWTKFTF